MKTVIYAYLIICIAVCVLKRVMPVILAIGFIGSWYMICYGDMVVPGIILGVVMCFITTLYKIARGDEFHEGRKPSCEGREKRKDEAKDSVRWIYYLIPIFWPFLIAKVLIDDRHKPTDMTPYDYEQHLKSNR